MQRPDKPTRFIPLNRASPEPEPEQAPVDRPGSSPSPMQAMGTSRSNGRTRSGSRKSAKSRGSDGDEGELANIPEKVLRKNPSKPRIPVPTKHRDNAQRTASKNRSGALSRLGITPDQCRSLARITHLLEYADGGVPAVLCALRLAESPDADKFLAIYDGLSASDRDRVTIEEISLAAGIGPKRLLELAVSALVEDSQSLGKIIAASYHPKVIQATAQCAYLFPDNQSDRRLFLQGTGFTPQPANRAGGVFVQNTINLPPVPETAGTDTLPDDGPVFNAAEDDLIRLHTTIDGEKLLEAPKTIVDASKVQIGHQYEGGDLECIPSKRS